MLDLAREVLGPFGERVVLQRGFIDDAPHGPFDGATCLRTLHFLNHAERLNVLHEMRRRLKPGARLAVAHHSYPAGCDVQTWVARSIAFADTDRNDLEAASASAEVMADRLLILSSEEEEALLHEAGFSGIVLFYAALSFRGWIATA